MYQRFDLRSRFGVDSDLRNDQDVDDDVCCDDDDDENDEGKKEEV